jgi:ATP synthase protein I
MRAQRTGPGGGDAKSDAGAKSDRPSPPEPREGTGWSIVSYLVGGMLLYGGIGWLIGRWTHIQALTGVGILLGIGLSLALIIFRFTRQ